MKPISESDKETIYNNFHATVNLSAAQLVAWLDTKESQSVGIYRGTTNRKKTSIDEIESIGHESGRRTVMLLSVDRQSLDDDDYRHMKRVSGYIRRHQAQVPRKSDIRTSRWRYSLMNWGHDPLK